MIKNNVEKRMPKIIEELKKFMVEEWDAISDKTVNNLVLSMENRCKLVLKEMVIEFHTENFMRNKRDDKLSGKSEIV